MRRTSSGNNYWREVTAIDLLFAKRKTTTEDNTRIITMYSTEHKKVKQIFSKYWHLLTSDPNIGSFISPSPPVTHRRVPSVGDLLVQTEFRGQAWGDPCKLWGTFPCGSCAYCQYMDTRGNICLPNGWRFTPTLPIVRPKGWYTSCNATAII